MFMQEQKMEAVAIDRNCCNITMELERIAKDLWIILKSTYLIIWESRMHLIMFSNSFSMIEKEALKNSIKL
jgi:hypothetical protein